jgi:NADH-quinone oxidoreductase subunit M
MFINTQNIINYLLILPLFGILSLLLIPSWNHLLLKKTALLFSSLTFILSIFLWIWFNAALGQFQYTSKLIWISSLNLNFTIGVDGISLFFILLTTLLIFLCLLVSWGTIKQNLKLYLISFLLLEFFLIGVFCVLDLLLFYIFFESVLIPMYLIIGFWGSRERKIRAAYFFFFFVYFIRICTNVISRFVYILSNRNYRF